jgi:hypothetical protein
MRERGVGSLGGEARSRGGYWPGRPAKPPHPRPRCAGRPPCRPGAVVVRGASPPRRPGGGGGARAGHAGCASGGGGARAGHAGCASGGGGTHAGQPGRARRRWWNARRPTRPRQATVVERTPANPAAPAAVVERTPANPAAPAAVAEVRWAPASLHPILATLQAALSTPPRRRCGRARAGQPTAPAATWVGRPTQRGPGVVVRGAGAGRQAGQPGASGRRGARSTCATVEA